MALPESQAFIRAAVGRALASAGLKQEAAAALMGIAPPLFSRQLAGMPGDHLSLQRLILIDDPVFWRSLLEDLRLHMGVREPSVPDVARALSTLMVSIGKAAQEINALRMAKAALPAGQRDRRRA